MGVSSVNKESAKKMSLIANSAILMYVLFMFLFYIHYSIKVLVLFSIPTISIYLIGYFLISKYLLYAYINIVYAWICLYMCVTTICLGYNLGFHLYCMSMIPVIFVIQYMGYKLEIQKVKPLHISLMVAISYLACVVYTVIKGSIYNVDRTFTISFLIVNSVTVIAFLITYANILVNLVIKSEEQLKVMAHMDKLTGLYNRHYMIEHIEKIIESKSAGFVAMIDIDNFKNINDTYGHDCGDYVLAHITEIMKNVCDGCTISRWGGEEFLITADSKDIAVDIMEILCKSVEDEHFEYKNKTINVTVTIGVAIYEDYEDFNKWIRVADKKLYYGKNNGKNMVVK